MWWKKIRRLLLVLLTVGLIFLGIIFIDLKVTRGYFLSAVLSHQNFSGIDVPEKDSNLVYEITTAADGEYNFRFENNAFTPKFFPVFRYDSIRYGLNDQTFFSYASNSELFYRDTVIGFSGGYGCGQGLGPATINPFEVFEMNFTYQEVIEKSFYALQFIAVGDSMVDPIYKQRLPMDSNNLWIEIDPHSSVIPITDSIAVQFYINLESVTKNERYAVKANSIQVGYLDLINYGLLFNRRMDILYR